MDNTSLHSIPSMCRPWNGIVAAAEASAPKVYPTVILASASTLSGSVVRILRGGEWLPKDFEPWAPPQPVFDCLRLLFTNGTQEVCGGVEEIRRRLSAAQCGRPEGAQGGTRPFGC